MVFLIITKFKFTESLFEKILFTMITVFCNIVLKFYLSILKIHKSTRYDLGYYLSGNEV